MQYQYWREGLDEYLLVGIDCHALSRGERHLHRLRLRNVRKCILDCVDLFTLWQAREFRKG